MPILTFKRMMVAPILAGTKVHTIRPDGRRAHKPGETLYMTTGDRYHPERFAVHTCTHVRRVKILEVTVMVYQPAPALFFVPPLDVFARCDGFENWEAMRDWFARAYSLPFVGNLIQWAPAEWEVTTCCRDCGGRMPLSPNRVRNAANPPGEFPYCSTGCAHHAYWTKDLPAALDEMERKETCDDEIVRLAMSPIAGCEKMKLHSTPEDRS